MFLECDFKIICLLIIKFNFYGNMFIGIWILYVIKIVKNKKKKMKILRLYELI